MNEQSDIINQFYKTSKIFNEPKTNKRIADHTFTYGAHKNPKEFFNHGKSNMQCTLQPKNYLTLRFKYTINDLKRRTIVMEETTTQYVKKENKRSTDRCSSHAVKIIQLKQMVERMINENNIVVSAKAQSNHKGGRTGEGGAKVTILDDSNVSIKSEIDCGILKANKITKLPIAIRESSLISEKSPLLLTIYSILSICALIIATLIQCCVKHQRATFGSAPLSNSNFIKFKSCCTVAFHTAVFPSFQTRIKSNKIMKRLNIYDIFNKVTNNSGSDDTNSNFNERRTRRIQ